MWKTQDYLRRHWPDLQVPVLGLAIGMVLFLGIRAISPHQGESCTALGQVREELELGMPSQPLMCIATLDGDLMYGRVILPPKKKRPLQ